MDPAGRPRRPVAHHHRLHIDGLVGRRAAGFTLVETLIALVLSSIVLLLVSTTFLVQNNYYSSQTQRTGIQDNARVATELIASEVRNAMDSGLVVAGARTLTVRSPMLLAIVCNRAGSTSHDVHSDGGQAAIDVDEVAGVAFRDAATGVWTYGNSTWASLNGSDATSATNCEANGADTVGAYDEYHRLSGLNTHFSPDPQNGDVLMLFRETTYTIRTSSLDSTQLGLFRQVYGAQPIEFATGMDTTAQFQYRTGGSTYADTIVATSLASIDAVRVVADARRPAQTGGTEDLTFGWSVNVSLRNVR